MLSLPTKLTNFAQKTGQVCAKHKQRVNPGARTGKALVVPGEGILQQGPLRCRDCTEDRLQPAMQGLEGVLKPLKP